MFLRRIIETKFVPSVLLNYEKQSDNESSDERQINVQQIFVCTKTGSENTKNIISVACFLLKERLRSYRSKFFPLESRIF